MATVYLVFREGDQRRWCCGVFTIRERAIVEADVFARNDVDSHHVYRVYPFVLDEPIKLGPKPESHNGRYYSSPELREPDPIYSTYHKDES